MRQVSKNILFSNRDNETFDEMFKECFDTQSMISLSSITDPQSFFLQNIYPKLKSLTKQSLSKIKPHLPLKQEQRYLFFYHLISGGGGSVFKYKDFIFKVTPKSSEISSEKDIAEISVPKYLKKLFTINCYNQLSDFVAIPLYIRYGNFSIELKALSNIHQLTIIMLAYTLLTNDGVAVNKSSLTNKIANITHDEKMHLNKESQINILLLSYYLDVKPIILNNLFSFNVIPKSQKEYGYLTISEPAIMSANKLSAHTLMEYFKDSKLSYNKLLEQLSMQMIFQVLVFYHVLLQMKPAFVHRDLKLDNILVREQPSHRIHQCITINNEEYQILINSPLIFLINDFEKSEIESSKSWIDDFNFLFYSIKHYKNVTLPRIFYIKFDKEDSEYEAASYDDLGKLIKDDMFKSFVSKR